MAQGIPFGFEFYSTGANELISKFTGLGRATDQVSKKNERFSGGLKGITGDLGIFRSTMIGATEQFAPFMNSMTTATYLTKQFVQGIIAGYQEFAIFDNKMREVTTLFRSDAALEAVGGLQQLKDVVKDTAMAYGQDLVTTAQAAYDAISAGVDPTALKDFQDVASQLAIGGATSISVATDALTSLVNAYGISYTETEQLKLISDSLFTGMQFGKTTINELGKNLSKVTPISASLNIHFSETIAALSALTLKGTSTARASVELGSIMSGLMKPTSTAAKMFDQLGISYGQTAFTSYTAADAQKYLGLSMEEVQQSADSLGMSVDEFVQKNALQIKLNEIRTKADDAGIGLEKLITQQNALRGFLSITGEAGGAKAFMEMMKPDGPMFSAMKDAGAVSQRAFEQVASGLKFQMDKLSSTFKVLKDDALTIFEPMFAAIVFGLQQIMEFARPLINAFRPIMDSFKSWFGGVAAHMEKIKGIKKEFTQPIKIDLDDKEFKQFVMDQGESWKVVTSNTEVGIKKLDEYVKMYDQAAGKERKIAEMRSKYMLDLTVQEYAEKFKLTEEEAAQKQKANENAFQSALKYHNLVNNVNQAIAVGFKNLFGELNEESKAILDRNPLGKFIIMIRSGIQGLVTGFKEAFRGLSDSKFLDGIVGAFKVLFEIGKEIFGIFQSVVSQIFPQTESGASGIYGVFKSIGDVIGDILPLAVKAFAMFKIGAVVFSLIQYAISPIGALIMGIVTGVIAFSRALQQSKESVTFLATINDVLNGIMSLFSDAVSFIAGIVGEIVNLLTPIFQMIIEGVARVRPYINQIFVLTKQVFDSIYIIVKSTVGMLVSVVSDWIEKNKETIISLWQRAVEIFTRIYNFVSGIVKGIAQVWETNILPPLKRVFEAIGSVIGTIVSAVKKVFDAFSNLVPSMNAAGSAGMSAGEGIGKALGFVLDVIAWLVEAFAFGVNFMINAWAWFYTSMIQSVELIWEGFLWVTVGIGNLFIGMWNGIVMGTSIAVGILITSILLIPSAMSQVAQFIANIFISIWNGIVGFAQNVYQIWLNTGGNIGDFFVGLWNMVAEFMNQTVTKIRNALFDMIEGLVKHVRPVLNFLGIKLDFLEDRSDIQLIKTQKLVLEQGRVADFSAAQLGPAQFAFDAFDIGRDIGTGMNDALDVGYMEMPEVGISQDSQRSLSENIARTTPEVPSAEQQGQSFADRLTQDSDWSPGVMLNTVSDSLETAIDEEGAEQQQESLQAQQSQASSLEDIADAQSRQEAERAEMETMEAIEPDVGKEMELKIELNDPECGRRRSRKNIRENTTSQFVNWHCKADLVRTGS